MMNNKEATVFALVLSALSLLCHATNEIGGRNLLQESNFALYSNVYSDVPTALRSAILSGDLNLTTSLLTAVQNPNELGQGMRFPPGDKSQFAIVTPERVNDPDVIAIKGFAGASIRLGDCSAASKYTFADPSKSNLQIQGILKLAQAFIIAITPESGVFPRGVNQFKLQVNVINFLADRDLMFKVLLDDPKASNLARKLLVAGGSPVKAWPCYNCYPSKLCIKASWWCGEN